MFTYLYTIRLADTDASGLIFFASQFRIAHEAYEAFLASRKMGLREILATSDVLLPIVRAEADYRAPCAVGDDLAVEVRLERLGSTSFTLAYRLQNSKGEEMGTARSVHVALDKLRRVKVPLPASIRAALSALE